MATSGRKGVGPVAALSRRDFLRTSGLGVAGLALADSARASAHSADEAAVILLMLVGGPSQLETFDPKPDVPNEVRGPFGTIATALPGVRLGEHLPCLARRMDKLTLIRSLHHDAAPIHETGHQLIQTGRLCRTDREWPHLGSVAARLLGPRGGMPPFVVLPDPIGNTGVGVSHGQGAGFLGAGSAPFVVGSDPVRPGFDPRAIGDRAGVGPLAFDLDSERPATRDAYGRTTFGQSCLLARRLVEAGSRFVVVNMYKTVFGRPSWDVHGRQPFSTFDDYRNTVLPTFDRAFSALIDDLEHRGRLGSTLVVATGEFGRAPKLNPFGGRDHWPAVWSAALAGGGTTGGRVVGASDRQGAEPADRPITPAELAATIYQSLGIDPSATLPIPGAEPIALIDDARPVAELLA